MRKSSKRNWLNKAFSLVLCVVIFSSCRKSGIVNALGSGKSCESVDFDFEYLSTKGKASVMQGSETQNFSAYIRIQKDKKIWISARVAGIEGVRCLITPDSVFIRQKFPRREDKSMSVDELQKMFYAPVTFEMLQAMLVGNIYFPEDVAPKLKKKPESCDLSFSFEGYEVGQSLSRSTKKLSTSQVVGAEERKMQGEYSAHKEIEKQLFPFLQQYHVTQGDSVIADMKIQFKSVKFGDENTKFTF